VARKWQNEEIYKIKDMNRKELRTRVRGMMMKPQRQGITVKK
jgi:hypothetical protein